MQWVPGAVVKVRPRSGVQALKGFSLGQCRNDSVLWEPP